MVTKEMIKLEIDHVESKYLEPLYKIIKAFESADKLNNQILTNNRINDNSEWLQFINLTYGCLFDSPIERGNQGDFEIRENIE
ncbi:hypothetical protein JW964_03315 [candidate division KSB1 bacterium]|nr:hypothetical protein [candidate division KSB1 bacterium]